MTALNKLSPTGALVTSTVKCSPMQSFKPLITWAKESALFMPEGFVMLKTLSHFPSTQPCSVDVLENISLAMPSRPFCLKVRRISDGLSITRRSSISCVPTSSGLLPMNSSKSKMSSLELLLNIVLSLFSIV